MTDTSWIDEIEARANAATPGPWINQHYSLPEDGIGIIAANLGGLVAWATLFPTEIDAEDPCRAEAVADFIANAKTDIPRLTTALRASLAREKVLADVLRRFGRQWNTLSQRVGCIACGHPDAHNNGCPVAAALESQP